MNNNTKHDKKLKKEANVGTQTGLFANPLAS
jgi:hypothetical protein